MILLPAIDLKGGACVRLLQGRDEATTVYGIDPPEVASAWVRQGAAWLHVVNLDGAFGRASENLSIVAQIVETSGAKVEFGGGLRTLEDAKAAIDIGVDRLVVGTAAFECEDFLRELLELYGPEKTMVAIDARDGIVTAKGWTSTTGRTVMNAATWLESAGVQLVLYTDVHRDGMLTGPDFMTLNQLLSSTGLHVIASGGVASLGDLRHLAEIKNPRLAGAIVGKALYDRKFSLSQALEAIKPIAT